MNNRRPKIITNDKELNKIFVHKKLTLVNHLLIILKQIEIKEQEVGVVDFALINNDIYLEKEISPFESFPTHIFKDKNIYF